MTFPTPFLAILLATLFRLATSSPAPLANPDTNTIPPPPPPGGSPNDGYGDIPPAPATTPYFPPFPIISIPFFTMPGLPNPVISTKTGGGVVVTPHTTKSTDPGATLSGYTFSPPPVPSTTSTSGAKTTGTVGGVTGPPVTIATDPCVKASVSLSVVTAVGSTTYSTHVVEISYTTIVQPVTSYTTIVQPVTVTLPSVGVSAVTSVATLTHSICLVQTTITSTKTAGGVTGPSPSGGTTTAPGGGGGGGTSSTSTCVWAAPTVTGEYTISASAVDPGATNQGVSGYFSGNPATSLTNLNLGQSVPLPYAEYKCSLLCGARCASFYVGYATSGASYYCYTYSSLLTPLDLIPLDMPPATTIIFGAAFNKLCSGTPPSSVSSSVPGGPGGGSTSTTKTADGGFTTLASITTSASGGGGTYGAPPPPTGYYGP
ncbi:uncharacterized protein PAC_17177 [Phialocephala subalpina]|uniref:Apple domain-containing protein n=1 Tax=Phialocephala subalpina TaxID=576137 RepID=A0A1L7XQP3_9HELO|nr:uncharacterized protein PAC_17177 [Phialocephala subalpina]